MGLDPTCQAIALGAAGFTRAMRVQMTRCAPLPPLAVFQSNDLIRSRSSLSPNT